MDLGSPFADQEQDSSSADSQAVIQNLLMNGCIETFKGLNVLHASQVQDLDVFTCVRTSKCGPLLVHSRADMRSNAGTVLTS